MHRLSRSRPVAYIEPSHSLLRATPSDRPPGPRPPGAGFRSRQISDSLWILTPPPGLPFWTHPWVSPIQYLHWGRLLRRAVRRLGFERTWLWLYHPLYIQCLRSLVPERVIFDLVDDLAAYRSRAHSRRTMERCVQSALARADLVLATSPALAEAHASRTREGKIHLVPNGVRGDWLSLHPSSLPEDVRQLPRPRLGVVGALFSYLDYSLLRAVAQAFPEGSLILLGPVQDPSAAALGSEPNVVLLGSRPQEKIPEYLAAFDVCLVPFQPGRVRSAVNPLKLYEYLALGRPVVSTPIESLGDPEIARWIRTAEGSAAFIAAIRESLTEDASEAQSARREAVRLYTWEALGDRVESILVAAESEWRRETSHV